MAEYAAGDQTLCAAVMGLLENRAAIKKPVRTLRAVNGILNDLEKYAEGDRAVALQMIDKATKSNWLTVYPLKPDERPQAAGGTEKEEYGWQM